MIEINTSLYCTAGSAQDESHAVVIELQKLSWSVILADVQPISSTLNPLSYDQPFQLRLDRPGATSADAERDVASVIHKTGNWSIGQAVAGAGGAIVGAVSAVADATGKVTGAVGDFAKSYSQDPNAPRKTLTTIEVVAASVAVVVGVLGTIYVMRLVRSAS